jgi:hypothetical protein
MLRCVSVVGTNAGEAMIETPGELLVDKGVTFYAQSGFKDQQDRGQHRESTTRGHAAL